MAQIFAQPFFQAWYQGFPAAGAVLSFFLTETSTPEPVFADADLSTPLGITVTADGLGKFPPIYLDSAKLYRVRLANAVGVLIADVDPVNVNSITAGDLPSDPASIQPIIDKLQPQQKYWLTRYGAVGDGSVVDTAFAAWRAAIASDTTTLAGPLKLAPLGTIPKGDYQLTTDQELPFSVVSYGRLTGAGKLRATSYQNARFENLYANGLVVTGNYSTTFDQIFAPITVKGGGTNVGSFWNQFRNVTGAVTIDLTDWSVNFNLFMGGKGDAKITGSTGNLIDGHANMFFMQDVTDGPGNGLENDSSVAQTNWAIGTYYEGGKDIIGDWHLWGFNGDAGGPPRVKRHNHALGSTQITERNSADFIAASTGNLAIGGEWDFLDSSGKPQCLSAFGADSSGAVIDGTEPFGIGKSFNATFTGSSCGFQIDLPVTSTGRFEIVLAYTALTVGAGFPLVEVNRGGGDITYGGASSVDAAFLSGSYDWKLLRIAGKASKTAGTTVRLYVNNGAGSASKQLRIGGIRASQEKAVLLPGKTPSQRFNAGIAIHGKAVIVAGTTQGYVNAGTSVDVVVPFGVTFATTPADIIASIVLTHPTQSLNFSKYLVVAATTTQCTVRVFYTTEWTGRVSVTVSGDLA